MKSARAHRGGGGGRDQVRLVNFYCSLRSCNLVLCSFPTLCIPSCQYLSKRATVSAFLPEDEVVDILLQLCLALSHIHQLQIIHRGKNGSHDQICNVWFNLCYLFVSALFCISFVFCISLVFTNRGVFLKHICICVDFKPSNIFIRHNNSGKTHHLLIGDFGVSTVSFFFSM